MTTKIICSVYDAKGAFYSTPFVALNEDIAARDFGAIVRDVNSLAAKFPEDFRLVVLGYFDDVTGELTAVDHPKFLVDAMSFIKE